MRPLEITSSRSAAHGQPIDTAALTWTSKRVLETLEQVRDAEQVRRAIAQRDTSATDPFALLTRVFEALGQRCVPLWASINEATRTLSADRVLVARSREPGAPWVIVAEPSRSEMWIETSTQGKRITCRDVDVIRQYLGWDGCDEQGAWLVVTPGRPLASLEASCVTPGLSVGEPQAALPEPTPIGRLIAWLKLERRDVAVMVVYAVAVGILALATPVAMQALVNTVSFGVLLQPLVVLSALLFGCLVFAAGLKAMETYVVEILQRRMLVRLVEDVSYRLPRAQSSSFDHHYGPELVNRFFDIFTVKKVTAWLLLEGLEIALTTGMGLVLLAFYHPLLLAFDVVLILAILLILLVLGRGGGKTAIKESKAKYALAGWLEEIARHPTTFKGTGGPALAMDRADALVRDYLKLRGKHFNIAFRQILGFLGLQALATAGLVAVGGWLVMEGQLTLGQLVAAELVVSLVVASLAKLSGYLESLYDLVAAIDKLGHLIDLPLERTDGFPLDVPTEQVGASLELRNVSFHYSSSKPLLKNANLVIKPGQRVALTGADSSGKSALLQLAFGLRQPNDGTILLDGHDLHALRLGEVRERVAILDDPSAFEGSVVDNVRMGRPDLPLRQVREALAAVDLLDEFEALPEGLETRLTIADTRLSTSQLIRLSLARAIAARPALLIIDDVFSSLSPKRIHTILKHLTKAPWTLVMISHSPAVLGSCERVVRMEDGALTEWSSLDLDDER